MNQGVEIKHSWNFSGTRHLYTYVYHLFQYSTTCSVVLPIQHIKWQIVLVFHQTGKAENLYRVGSIKPNFVMLHFTQKPRTGRLIIVAIVFSCCFNPLRSSAQIVDTVIMNNTGHDATAWWTSGCSWTDTLNGGAGEFMQCQRWTWSIPNCGEGEQIPHIRFSLPTIPSGHFLDKVELELFFPTGNPFPHSVGNNHIYVQRLTSTWDEMVLNWVNKPSYTTVEQVFVPAAVSGTQTYKIDITDIAEEWMDGSLPNHGVRLKLQNPSIYRRATFASSEHPDASLRPRIYFTYLPDTTSIYTNFTDTLVCNGSDLDIEVFTPGLSSPTFSWYSIPDGFYSNQQSITVNPYQNTQYVVEVTNGGDTFSITVNVDVYDCCAYDTTSYVQFHKSFSGLVNEPHGLIIGGRADLTSSGDILLANYSDAAGTDEALLTKINPNGNYNWTRAFDLPDYEAGLSALELSTGDYLLIGHTQSLGSGQVNLFVQKVDANGTNIIWTRVYDQTVFDVATAHAVELLNGDIAIAGFVSAATGDEIAITHLDNSGFIISYDVKAIPNKDGLMVNDIIATSDGGFLICGEAAPGMANDYYGALLMKFDDVASLMWAEVYRFPSSSGIYDLSSSNPADISVTRAFSVMEDVALQKYIVAGDISDIYTFNDAMVWEVDPFGMLTAANRLTYQGLWSSYLGISQSSANGEYLLTGYLHDLSTSTEITLLSRCDNTLNFNLHSSYGTLGVSSVHRGIDVFEQVGSTDYLIHGRSIEPFMSQLIDPQAYVIRTDMNGFNGCELGHSPIETQVFMDQFSEWETPNPPIVDIVFNAIPMHDFCGNLVDRCAPGLLVHNPNPDNSNSMRQQNSTGQVSLSGNMEEKTGSITITPNPASDFIRLTLDLPNYQSVDLSIISMGGQELLQLKALTATAQHQVELPNLKAGLYILQLKSGNQILKQQKLVITAN